MSWPARSPDLSTTEHVWDMMKRELTLSPELATTIVELRQRVQDSWDDLSHDGIRIFMTICMPTIATKYTLYIDVAVWAPLNVTCDSFGLNLSYNPTTINYLSDQFSMQ